MWLTGPVALRHVGSPQTRDRTRVPCIGRQILNHCATRETLTSGFDSVWPVGGNGKTAEDWGRKKGKQDFPDASLLSSWLCVPGNGGILGSPLLLGGLSSWTPAPTGLPHRVPSPCLLPWRSAKRTSSCCQSLRTSHLLSVPSTRTHLWNQSIH